MMKGDLQWRGERYEAFRARDVDGAICLQNTEDNACTSIGFRVENVLLHGGQIVA
jgi:hypothetical protein